MHYFSPQVCGVVLFKSYSAILICYSCWCGCIVNEDPIKTSNHFVGANKDQVNHNEFRTLTYNRVFLDTAVSLL